MTVGAGVRAGRRIGAVASALVAGAVVAAMMAACSGKGPPVMPGPETLARRNEITALATQIRAWRHEAGMDVEPDDDTVMAMARTSAASAARACVLPGPSQPRCADVCDLADAICDNAEAICAIAAELGDDAWAIDKCDSAKASCREAQERCCECNRDEATP